MDNKKVLIIMRGIPGSGKSTRANQLLQELGANPDGHIFSTDNFWIPKTRESRRQGQSVNDIEEIAEYKANFDTNKLALAHRRNLDEFKRAVDNGVTPLILDNTNVKAFESRAYAEYAEKAEYTIKVEEPTSDWWKEYSPLLKDKKANEKELDKFAHILFEKNKHGVPLQVIKNMIQKWQPNLTPNDILDKKD